MMEVNIYFNISGERKGPFSIIDLIDKLQNREFALMDFVYCKNISEIWISVNEFLFKSFPQLCDNKFYVSPGDGQTEGPIYFNNFIRKILSNKKFIDEYLFYNKQENKWQLFKDFLASYIISQGKLQVNELNEQKGSEAQLIDSEDRSATDVVPEEIKVLDQMIAESTEFKKLSSSLSGFNLWELFDIKTLEGFNEKMLFWLLKENESHNLGDFFLRRWLILILHKDLNSKYGYKRPLNALNIEYARVVDSTIESQKMISINGRTRFLDLFLDLKTLRQEDWVIIIEIKVGSYDHENQLSDYRKWLNEKYPNHKKLTIFLYDENLDQQLPDDEDQHWLRTTFSDIRNVIKEALKEKQGLIPFREESFIEQYMENLPPLAPEGKSENLDELTHALFGHYSSGIKYAIMANNQKIENLSSWQLHARYFVQERKKEFFLLAKQNETNFLKKQLSHDLSCGSWFPNTTQLPDLIVFNPNDYGIDLVSLMVDNDSKWSDSISINHLSVYIHLFHGTYQGHSRFRLRIRVPEQNGFEEKRNDLINDFFGQINPYNYGGNHGTNKSSGLIYNKVLNYESSENLFTLSHSIVKSLFEIWCEDDNFLMAINAILEHVRD